MNTRTEVQEAYVTDGMRGYGQAKFAGTAGKSTLPTHQSGVIYCRV